MGTWVSIALVVLFVLAVLAGLLGWVRVIPGQRSLKQEMAFWWVAFFPVLVVSAFFIKSFLVWFLLIFLFFVTCYFFHAFASNSSPLGFRAVSTFVKGIYSDPEATIRKIVEGFNKYCKPAE